MTMPNHPPSGEGEERVTRYEQTWDGPMESEVGEFVLYSDYESRIEQAEARVEEARRAVEWLVGEDAGLSSQTICAHMLGVERKHWGHGFAPRDEQRGSGS